MQHLVAESIDFIAKKGLISFDLLRPNQMHKQQAIRIKTKTGRRIEPTSGWLSIFNLSNSYYFFGRIIFPGIISNLSMHNY